MKTLREQIENKCNHFTGLMQKTCNKGHCYDDMDAENRLPMRRGLPCLRESSQAEPCSHCPDMEYPTEEQIAAELASMDERVDRMKLVLATLKPLRKEHKGTNWRGTITCPVCQGNMHVTHAAYNNHMSGVCESDDCLNWRE